MTENYFALLSEYSAYVRRAGHIDTAATALRTRSRTLRDVMAYIATYDRFSIDYLQKFAADDSMPKISFRNVWLAALGRVTALQAFQERNMERHEADISFGLACLRVANQYLPHDNEHSHFHRLEVELLVRQGHLQQAEEIVKNHADLQKLYYGYIQADLKNPRITGVAKQYTRWLTAFNRPFTENGLLPIEPSPSQTPAFNELLTKSASPDNGEPTVSVIMTSFKPDQVDFLLAVKSILNQTWRNIELIIVDDASPTEFKNVLNAAKSLDSRVRVIELDRNGGTYRARNIGISLAKGEFITGQDSDDWSHPERIGQQINYISKNPSVPGVVVDAIRMNNDLVRMFPGRKPHRLCEVSLMLRKELVEDVGGYLEARKGADSEFRRRIERFSGQQIRRIEKPLYLTRIGHESLSGADFKPGWSHPVRRMFWNASTYWHEKTQPSQVRLTASNTSPIPIPNRFKIAPPPYGPHFDAVFISDWRAYGGSQRVMLDEIVALKKADKKIGIMHLESPLSPSKETTRLCEQVQSLINGGYIEEIVPDENASSTVAFVYDPTILQFTPGNEISFVAKTTLIAPDIPPPTNSVTDVLYLPEDCDHLAKKLFKGDVIWTSTDPALKKQLTSYAPGLRIHPSTKPVAFQSRRWANSRRKLNNATPIVGRHAENHVNLWPATLETTEKLWSAGETTEVRILGDARALLRKHGKRRYPLSWVNFRDQEITPEAFMRSIDFFVYYPEETYTQSFCREALEAAAAGTLVMLPTRFKPMHGSTAIYPSPEDVPVLIEDFAKNTRKYGEQVQTSSQLLDETYNNRNYIDYVDDLETTTFPSKYSSPENHAFS